MRGVLSIAIPGGLLPPEVRHALRRMRRRPWRSVAAVGTLGLAIGIATAMFVVVDAIVLRPVPFRNAAEIARLRMSDGPSAFDRALFAALRRAGAFAAVEAAVSSSAIITGDFGDATQVMASVSPGTFGLLGPPRPTLGRLFDDSDAIPGGDPCVLISETTWKTYYHGDTEIIGRAIIIDDKPVRVVGVLPSSFRFPTWNTAIWRATDFTDPRPGAPGGRPVVYVRFARDKPVAESLRAATAMSRIGSQANAREVVRAVPLATTVSDDFYRRAVPLLAGGVALLCLALAANAATLMLVGLTRRRPEFAMRAALGASRQRLIRESFVEGMLLGVGSTIAGIYVGWLLVSVSRTVLEEAALLRSLNVLSIDVRAVAVALLAGLLVSVGTGVSTAVVGSRAPSGGWLRMANGVGADIGPPRRGRRTLLVLQIGVSMTLLFGATLLGRSFVKLATQGRGFDTGRIMVATVDFPSARLATAGDRAMAARTLLDAVRAIPGIRVASWSYGTPPGGGLTDVGFWTSDAGEGVSVKMRVDRHIIESDFFAVYGIPILKGRTFQSSDDEAAILVSERFAGALWPGGLDVIGGSVRFEGRSFHVIGLVGEVRFPSLDRTRDAPQWYMRLPGISPTAMLTVRCNGACPDTSAVRRPLGAADPRVRVRDVRVLESVYSRELARPRAMAMLALLLAVTSLAAVAVGLFGVQTQNLAERRREFAIRTALGAAPNAIRRLVWRDALAIAIPGLGLGAIGSAWVSQLLSALLFDVGGDSLSWVLVAGSIGVVVALSTWHPSRMAGHIAPASLMRGC